MASPELTELMIRAEKLTPDERVTLMMYLLEGLRRTSQNTKPRPRWSDIQGSAPYPMVGEDAQEWVTRTRREGDEARARGLRGES